MHHNHYTKYSLFDLFDLVTLDDLDLKHHQRQLIMKFEGARNIMCVLFFGAFCVVNLVNPRPGGGELFLAPLQTFQYISRTAAPFVTKLAVHFRASI